MRFSKIKTGNKRIYSQKVTLHYNNLDWICESGVYEEDEHAEESKNTQEEKRK